MCMVRITQFNVCSGALPNKCIAVAGWLAFFLPVCVCVCLFVQTAASLLKMDGSFDGLRRRILCAANICERKRGRKKVERKERRYCSSAFVRCLHFERQSRGFFFVVRACNIATPAWRGHCSVVWWWWCWRRCRCCCCCWSRQQTLRQAWSRWQQSHHYPPFFFLFYPVWEQSSISFWMFIATATRELARFLCLPTVLSEIFLLFCVVCSIKALLLPLHFMKSPSPPQKCPAKGEKKRETNSTTKMEVSPLPLWRRIVNDGEKEEKKRKKEGAETRRHWTSLTEEENCSKVAFFAWALQKLHSYTHISVWVSRLARIRCITTCKFIPCTHTHTTQHRQHKDENEGTLTSRMQEENCGMVPHTHSHTHIFLSSRQNKPFQTLEW